MQAKGIRNLGGHHLKFFNICSILLAFNPISDPSVGIFFDPVLALDWIHSGLGQAQSQLDNSTMNPCQALN